MAQIVIKNKKSGMKSLVNRLKKLGYYTISCGIHDNEGKRRVMPWSFKQTKKQEIKKRKPKELREKDKKIKTKKSKQYMNVATLASILEKYSSWRQEKTAKIPSADGGFVTIQAGKRYKRPPRIFIKLYKDSKVWNEIRTFIRNRFKLFLVSKITPAQICKDIAIFISNRQKQRITRKETKGNSSLTIKVKGENYPLYKSGLLLNSIKGRVLNRKGRSIGLK